MQRLVLVGAGHAHLEVLHQLGEQPLPQLDIVLVSPEPSVIYSGMMPGWFCGQFAFDDCCIGVAELTRTRGVRWIDQALIAMDPTQRTITLTDHSTLSFDYLSLNMGAAIDCSWLRLAGARLVPAKPMITLAQRMQSLLSTPSSGPNKTVVVVGGGAAGVELSLSIKHFLNRHSVKPAVHLITGDQGYLAGFSKRVQSLMAQALKDANVEVHAGRCAGHEDGVLLASGRLLAADLVVAATGATRGMTVDPNDGLRRTTDGLLVVDRQLRCVGQERIFAVGDGCVVQNQHYPRCGANAVRAGKILAGNLRSSLDGTALKSFKPRTRPLTILRTAHDNAILTWGGLALSGHWCSRLKDFIDLSYMRRHHSPITTAASEGRSKSELT